MRKMINKYFKFWPILGLILLFSTYFIYERPRTAEDILGISSDTTFEFCHVHVKEWNEAILNTKDAELTEEEFKHVVETLKENKYRKYSGNKGYTSHTGSYYSITFSYFMNENNQDHQTLTITKGNLLDINDSWYVVSSEGELSKEVVQGIYEYISNLLRGWNNNDIIKAE